MFFLKLCIYGYTKSSREKHTTLTHKGGKFQEEYKEKKGEKKEGSSSRRILINPNVSLWARVFINAIHALVADHDVDNMIKVNIAKTWKHNGAIVSTGTQIQIYNSNTKAPTD